MAMTLATFRDQHEYFMLEISHNSATRQFLSHFPASVKCFLVTANKQPVAAATGAVSHSC
jgi:hypothetical protein